ncbi:MAG: AAA family ATPase [Treponema sp.]|nr:AAA family ATPase [Treponema sp.]
MKPNKLILKNIGPFTEQTVIDFETLGNMFLICGDTGSGKTTIFDSICYALYGSLPGSYPKMPRSLRSDFALKDEIAEVIFDFSINNCRYKVERMPPKPYTDRNGKESEKPAEVVFYKFTGNKTQENWTVISNKTQEADAAISNLIGLTIKEFSKIVLLPQGDFAEFLRLSSNDRKIALAKLFPIDDYRLITEFAKNKEDEFRSRQKLITAQIESLQKNFDSVYAEEQINQLKAEEKSCNSELLNLNKQQMQFAAQLENARALDKKFDNLETLISENEKIIEQKTSIENLENTLEQNRKALFVKPVFEAFIDIAKRLEVSKKSLAKTEQDLKESTEVVQNLENSKDSIESKKTEIGDLHILINEFQRAVSIEKDMLILQEESLNAENQKKDLSAKLESCKIYIDNLKKEADSLEEAILPQEELENVFDKSSKELEEAKNKKTYLEEYKKLQKEAELTKEGFESSKTRYEKAKKNFELLKEEIIELESKQNIYEQSKNAFAFAKNLKDGEPCPVCGSVHHPKLAVLLNEDFSIEERIALKKSNLPEAESTEREAFAVFSGVKSRFEAATQKLESCEAPVLNAAELLDFAISQMNEAVAKRDKNRQNNNRLADIRRKQEKAQNDYSFIQNDLYNCTQIYISKNTKYENLKNQFDSLTKDKIEQGHNVAATLENLKIKLDSLQNEITVFNAEKESALKLMAEYSATKEFIKKQTEELEQKFNISSTTLDKELYNQGFSSVEKLEASFLSESERISFENQIPEWKSKKEQLAGQIESLKADVKDSTRPNIIHLEKESEKIDILYQEKTQKFNEIVLKKQNIVDNLKHWQSLNEEIKNLEKNSQVFVALSKDLSGDNIKKLSFESWILGVYLEEIAVHASRRLARISDGRYSLHLKIDKSSGHQKYAGLDLEIFDANTGKKRPCDTLSGGETFFVSISLALALTDVVQSRSGGVQLDSLFIDEGFGSLDDVTLEKALSVLDEIRENRMIGIISHVGELKNRIHHRIEVTKKQNGSTLTVVGE